MYICGYRYKESHRHQHNVSTLSSKTCLISHSTLLDIIDLYRDKTTFRIFYTCLYVNCDFFYLFIFKCPFIGLKHLCFYLYQQSIKGIGIYKGLFDFHV